MDEPTGGDHHVAPQDDPIRPKESTPILPVAGALAPTPSKRSLVNAIDILAQEAQAAREAVVLPTSLRVSSGQANSGKTLVASGPAALHATDKPSPLAIPPAEKNGFTMLQGQIDAEDGGPFHGKSIDTVANCPDDPAVPAAGMLEEDVPIGQDEPPFTPDHCRWEINVQTGYVYPDVSETPDIVQGADKTIELTQRGTNISHLCAMMSGNDGTYKGEGKSVTTIKIRHIPGEHCAGPELSWKSSGRGYVWSSGTQSWFFGKGTWVSQAAGRAHGEELLKHNAPKAVATSDRELDDLDLSVSLDIFGVDIPIVFKAEEKGEEELKDTRDGEQGGNLWTFKCVSATELNQNVANGSTARANAWIWHEFNVTGFGNRRCSIEGNLVEMGKHFDVKTSNCEGETEHLVFIAPRAAKGKIAGEKFYPGGGGQWGPVKRQAPAKK